MMESFNFQDDNILDKDVLRWIIDEALNLNVLIYTLLALVVAYGFYYILFRPINRVRNLGEIGYEYFKDEAKKQGKKLKDVVKRVQSLKKKGPLLPPFPNSWYAILESRDLRKGEVKSVSALGETFAVFRTKDGEVYVLDAYCPHLGANLAIGGKLVGSCLQCPFHGWQFNGKNGECVKVPYSDKVPPHSNVKKWLSIERTGLIYIWYHVENEEPTWFPPEIDEILNGELVYKGRCELNFSGHIFDIAENISDIAHFKELHSEPVFKIFNFQIIKYAFSANWKEGEAPNKHTSCCNVRSTVSLFDKISYKIKSNFSQYGSAIVHVYTTFTSHSRCLLIQSILPVAPSEQRVLIHVYTCYMPSIFISLYVHAHLKEAERDIMVWNFKKYTSKPILVKEESSIAQFRRWYAQFYSKNSLSFLNVKDSLYW